MGQRAVASAHCEQPSVGITSLRPTVNQHSNDFLIRGSDSWPAAALSSLL